MIHYLALLKQQKNLSRYASFPSDGRLRFKDIVRIMKNNKLNILHAIGNTPLIELTNVNSNQKIRIFGKLEGNNPGGSVKDRPVHFMIKKAEESGELTKEKIILEPTSGNTGIALAMIGAARGYRVKLLMPDCVSIERGRILEAFNAEVILTPADQGTDGAIRKAYQIINEEPDRYYMPNQFENENNVLAHYETTGPEIVSQTNGEVNVFVAVMGTTGTLRGAQNTGTEKYARIHSTDNLPSRGIGRKDCRWG